MSKYTDQQFRVFVRDLKRRALKGETKKERHEAVKLLAGLVHTFERMAGTREHQYRQAVKLSRIRAERR